eukprot:m51a1_g7358 putative horma domain-containing protein 1-like (478) ;mRNA; f:36205-38063
MADQEAPTQDQSRVLVRNLLRTALASLFWARAIFPQDCFENRTFAGMAVKKFRCCSRPDVDRVIAWVEGTPCPALPAALTPEGVLDAFNRGYLDTLIVGVEGDTAGPAPLLCESYSFKITEGAVAVQQPPGSAGAAQTTKKGIREAALQVMRNIALAVQTLGPLPDTRYVLMKLLYADAVTPAAYEPPHFRCATGGPRLLLASPALKVRLGRVQTPHHRLDLLLQSTADPLALGPPPPASRDDAECLDALLAADAPRSPRGPSHGGRQPSDAIVIDEHQQLRQKEEEGKKEREEEGKEEVEGAEGARWRAAVQTLAGAERVTSTGLARDLGVSRKHAAEILADLEARGFVGPLVKTGRAYVRTVNAEAVRKQLAGLRLGEQQQPACEGSQQSQQSQLSAAAEGARCSQASAGSQSQASAASLLRRPTTPPQAKRRPKIEELTPVRKAGEVEVEEKRAQARKASIAEDPRAAKKRRTE